MSDKAPLIKNDEFNLAEILKVVYLYKRLIIMFSSVFVLIGLIIAFGTPKEYKSEITVLIESTDNSGLSGLMQQSGALGSLAGIAGIKLNNNEEALTSAMYPDIIKSDYFLIHLMNKKIYDPEEKSTKYLYEYLNDNKKSLMNCILGVPSKLISLIKNQNNEPFKNFNFENPIISLSKSEDALLISLRNRIITSENNKGNLIKGSENNPFSVAVKMQNPVIAKQIADTILHELSKFIIEYRTQKLKTNYHFILERTNEAKNKFINSQQALAYFKDKNKYLVSNYAQSEVERLQAEYNLNFNLYNSLMLQLEQSRIQLQFSTPIFRTIEPSKIPYEKDSPKTLKILIISVVLGFVFGLIYVVFIKIIFTEIKEKIMTTTI